MQMGHILFFILVHVTAYAVLASFWLSGRHFGAVFVGIPISRLWVMIRRGRRPFFASERKQ
jgi:hypothetical protein